MTTAADQMTAMVCDGPGLGLRKELRPIPKPGAGEVLLEVLACGICRTDLHVLDGEIPARYPIVPGHEIVGRVLALGDGVREFAIGQRVGVPWLGSTCGQCRYCRDGMENLCDQPVFTGATRDGGYATHTVARVAFCFPIPDSVGDAEAAPLLCAGLIGWRSYRKACAGLAGGVNTLGLYGFGAAAHIIAQIAVAQGKRVFAFARQGDRHAQDFALTLGCEWAGASEQLPPVQLDAAILFAPVGALVPLALRAVRKGGRVVCAGIYMSDIPSFPYVDLWGEREVISVANLARQDGSEFLSHQCLGSVHTSTTCLPLEKANEGIALLRKGKVSGALVLLP